MRMVKRIGFKAGGLACHTAEKLQQIAALTHITEETNGRKAKSASSASISSSDHQYHSMQSDAFLLRCCMKESEFENASETLVELRGKMIDVIGRIDATTLGRVMDSLVSRAPFSVIPSAL